MTAAESLGSHIGRLVDCPVVFPLGLVFRDCRGESRGLGTVSAPVTRADVMVRT